MGTNNIDKLLSYHDKIEECIGKITDKCVELYGAEESGNIAKKILFDKDLSNIHDKKLLELIKELNYLEDEDSSENPYIKLLEQ